VRARAYQSGFLGGEIDPMMGGRTDTDNYGYGLAICENFVAMAIGPLVKRTGFAMIRAAAPGASMLTTFRFSVAQEYVLEWSDGKVRFYTNGGRVETSPGVPYELAVPYSAAEAPSISFQQNYDRLYCDHPAHPPGVITRTSAVTFTYAAVTLNNGPFADANTNQGLTIKASAQSGTVTLTATGAALFRPGHVGSLMRLESTTFGNINVWEPQMSGVALNVGVRSDGKEYVSQTAGTTGTVQPIHTSGQAWDGQGLKDVTGTHGPYGVLWQYLCDNMGIVQITAVAGDGMSATANVVRYLDAGLVVSGTYKWSYSLISNDVGWPNLVMLWQGRMIHFKDFDLVASVVGDFGGGQCNFATFTSSGQLAPDMAFRVTLATSDPPLWVAGDSKLLVGTASREIAIAPLSTAFTIAGPISASNLSATPQSFYGAQAIRPVQLGVQTIFVERGGRRLRSVGYDFSKDKFVADDMTVAAHPVTTSGIKQLAAARVPLSLLYAVRNDGQIAVHADTKETVKGFSRFVLGGGAQVLSAQAVVGADAVNDELWCLVSRSTPAGAQLEVWKQAAWREIGDPYQSSFYVDGGITAAASANQTHFSGLTHLASQAVAVLADGAVVPDLTVASDGTLDLPASAVPSYAYTITIGLAYSARAQTLSPEVKTRLGTSQGLIKRVVKAVLRLIETLGIKIGGTDPMDPLDEVILRSAADPMDAAPPLFTGDTEGLIETSYTPDGCVQWLSDVPLPAVITASLVSLDVDDFDA
jgi:hypothetical protein